MLYLGLVIPFSLIGSAVVLVFVLLVGVWVDVAAGWHVR